MIPQTTFVLTFRPHIISELGGVDRAANLATENINRSIKSVARTITKTSLSDKVSSKSVLEKAGLRPLNEMVACQTALMVWKSNKAKDPLGRKLFPKRSIIRATKVRSF